MITANLLQSLEKLEEGLKEARKQQAEAEAEESRLLEIVAAVHEVDEKLEKKRKTFQHLQSKSETQKSLLEEDLTVKHSMNELVEKKENFDKEMTKYRKRKEKLAREIQAIEVELEALRKEQINLNSSKGKLAAEKEAHEKRLRDRWAMMKKIDKAFGLDLQASMTQFSLDHSFSMDVDGADSEPLPLSKDDMRSFFSNLNKKSQELSEELGKNKKKARDEENECNTALNDLHGHLKGWEQGKEGCPTAMFN